MNELALKPADNLLPHLNEATRLTTNNESPPPRAPVRIPRITIHAFHQSAELAPVLERAAGDRLMSGARVTVHSGGVSAAVRLYSGAPTPNLIILESGSARSSFLAELDTLAQVCDAGTRLLVVGDANDVHFYRELIKRGVSDYVLAPIDPVSIVTSIASIYHDESSKKLGRTCAFVGAKGGVGSSTMAHNVAWTIGQHFAADVILIDMDLPFGTAALNFNTEPSQGVAEAIHDASRLDHVLLDRLLTKCGDHVGLLSAPAALDRDFQLGPQSVIPLLEVAQSTVPFTILDLPHQWSNWSRGLLSMVDDIVIVATPDLASLRNTKNITSLLKQARPHDPAPKLVLNQTGVPKRPEIKAPDFAKAVQVELTACVGFDPQLFGTAMNKGQMISQVSNKGDAVKVFGQLAQEIAQRKSSSVSKGAAPRSGAMLKRMLGR